MLTFAFYKHDGRLTDRFVRALSGERQGLRWTPAPYSHVEFVEEYVCGMDEAHCISASKRDGHRVRKKIIKFDPDHWDFLRIKGDYVRARQFAGYFVRDRVPYDVVGAMFSITGIPLTTPGHIHCSDLMALIAYSAGVKLRRTHSLTPWELYKLLSDYT